MLTTNVELPSSPLPTPSLSVSKGKKEHILALDVFRGITIAGMIIVNNPGSWSSVYAPLQHAQWDGCTPTDLIFPFFLFIMGVAMFFSFRQRSEEGSTLTLGLHIVKRSIVLFLLGIILSAFPGISSPQWYVILPSIGIIVSLQILIQEKFESSLSKQQKIYKIIAVVLFATVLMYWIVQGFDLSKTAYIRIPGVLQRISICYLMASFILISFRSILSQIIWVIVLTGGYWIITAFCSSPSGFISNAPVSGQLHDWLDQRLLGGCLYKERPDPEGLLSTIPAIATTLLGALCGRWLAVVQSQEKRLLGMFVVGNILIVLGLWMDYSFPLNKKIWSSSYTIYTAGVALELLAICSYCIDYLKIRRWTIPFLVFGTNSIVAFFASGLLMRIFYAISVDNMNLKQWLYLQLFASWAEPYFASFCFSIAFLLVWLLILLPLYYKKIFIKI